MPPADPETFQELAEALGDALAFQLRYQKEGAAWEVLIDNGRPAPDWWEACPDLLGHETVFLEAFWQLTTERQLGMGVGPIPWGSIRTYGLAKGFDSVTMGLFHVVIRAMDGVYLDWVIKQQQNRAPKQSPDKGGRGRRSKRPKRR